MKCNEAQELLSLYIDRELDESQIQAVEEHLAACSACNNEYLELSEMVNLLKEIEEVPLPESFDRRWNAVWKRKRRINWRIMTSLAAVFAVGLLSVSLYQDVIGDLANQKGTSDLAGMNYKVDTTMKSMDNIQDSDDKAETENGDLSAKQKESLLQDDSSESKKEASGTEAYGSSDSGQTVEETADGGESLQAAEAFEEEDASSSGSSRNLTMVSSDAASYYDGLIEEKLKDFEYQITESKYVNGEWHFSVFIFSGKDGNTYNEEITVIGKDGAIELLDADKVTGLE